MPISLFKVLFKVLPSLKIVSYTVYMVVKFILDLSHSQCPMADPFCQMFSVCVSVLQKVFPEPLFKEIKLSSFLSYYIALLSSSMYHFWELSQSVCNCIFLYFTYPFSGLEALWVQGSYLCPLPLDPQSLEQSLVLTSQGQGSCLRQLPVLDAQHSKWA